MLDKLLLLFCIIAYISQPPCQERLHYKMLYLCCVICVIQYADLFLEKLISIYIYAKILQLKNCYFHWLGEFAIIYLMPCANATFTFVCIFLQFTMSFFIYNKPIWILTNFEPFIKATHTRLYISSSACPQLNVLCEYDFMHIFLINTNDL